jgi:hypothetical protein
MKTQNASTLLDPMIAHVVVVGVWATAIAKVCLFESFTFGHYFNVFRIKDINECQLDGQVCANHSFCHNTRGSYDCHCIDGFRMHDNGVECLDINECLLENNKCGEFYFKCVNIIGSFACVCIDGFELTIDGSCSGKCR